MLDDASTDGTSDLVRHHFPDVRYWRSDVPRGYIQLRNHAAELAQAPIIISIDDDAESSTPDVVAQTLREFDHPAVGAVSIPFVDDLPGGPVERVAPAADERPWAVWTYVGTAHAVRREAFTASGGYQPALGHFGEELDLALRMLDRGMVVRAGRADRIIHHLSPQGRDDRRVWLYGQRNLVLSALLNVPAVSLPGTC